MSGTARKGDIPGTKKHMSKSLELRVSEQPSGNRERNKFPNVDTPEAGRDFFDLLLTYF